MLNNSQLTKLEEFEHFIMELIGSPEYQLLIESDYNPDIALADISQGIAEVLDYHIPSEHIAVSPTFQKLFSDCVPHCPLGNRQLSNKLTSIELDQLESFNNY